MNKNHFFIAYLGICLVLSGLGAPAFAQNKDQVSPGTAPASPVHAPPTGSLDSYLQVALQNSPLLKDYQGQVQAGQVDSQIVRAGYPPQVTGTSVDNYAPVINRFGYDNAISNGGN